MHASESKLTRCGTPAVVYELRSGKTGAQEYKGCVRYALEHRINLNRKCDGKYQNCTFGTSGVSQVEYMWLA